MNDIDKAFEKWLSIKYPDFPIKAEIFRKEGFTAGAEYGSKQARIDFGSRILIEMCRQEKQIYKPIIGLINTELARLRRE